MSATSTDRRLRSAQRRAQRAVGWEGLREYANGALWVLPSLAALLALLTGFIVSQIDVRPGTFLDRIAFQGTADDARSLLTAVTSTVVTVIALVLGLTVVALQLSSTQFSPRLLRNFLRDRSTQVVLGVFIATFVYSAAGLFTVGLEAGTRTETYPRLAVSGSIVLLFASLGMVVYYADHLVHSIQIDAINRRVEHNTRRAIARLQPHATDRPAPRAPEWAVPLTARKSGYVQTVHPELLMPLAVRDRVTICLRPRVGQHVITGTTVGWVWAATPEEPRPDPKPYEDAVHADVRIGFERTLEQDVAFGIRQQIDIASKALSPAVNDPYTAVQAIDHLTVVCCELAVRPLGADILTDRATGARVIVPGNTFSDYLFFITRLLGRFGAADQTVMSALVRLIRNCADFVDRDPARLATLAAAAAGVLEDAERVMQRPADRDSIRRAAEAVQAKIARESAGRPAQSDRTVP